MTDAELEDIRRDFQDCKPIAPWRGEQLVELARAGMLEKARLDALSDGQRDYEFFPLMGQNWMYNDIRYKDIRTLADALIASKGGQ